ncbi:efflux RND transporter periplasmic adaptor subunit [Panacagrimonas perspica]|uniref:efflux RND transporter periplasmic adaptor subunit n=1 Tax=Panacagrimonas perspica TaxID=381431 RepID=UPI001FE30526|nr:efflux RND transporter periplasmic adaptor subunit [Panacagrimonas perspica]
MAVIIVALAALAWGLTQRSKTQTTPGAMGGGPPGAGAPGGGGGRGRGGMPTTVGTAKVVQQDIPVILEALGTVTPSETVTVRPQVAGVITDIRFVEGQMVTQGQVLAVIDQRPFQVTLDQARGQLQRDEAELQNAQLQLERFRTLGTLDSIAQQDIDTQAASVKQLLGTVVADRAAVAAAQLDMDYSEVKTPIAGRVGLRVVDAGNYIGAGDASGIAVVTRVSPTDVVFTVPQDRVGEIQKRVASGEAPKIPAIALDRSRQVTLAEGTFSTLDNLVSTDTGTVRAKARFANADGALFPSQFVNVRLTLRVIEGASVVPVSAVRNGADGDFVWLLQDDDTATARKVQRGPSSGDLVQIVKGLEPGQTVITDGGDRLKEGGKVTLPGEKRGEAAAGDAPKGRTHGERGKRTPKDGAAVPAPPQ